MQARRDLSSTGINRDLLAFVVGTPRWFWLVLGGLALVAGAGVAGAAVMVWLGLGLLGYTHTVQWSVLITNLTFWVGISHAGVMMSAVLRLTDAEWRRPITRAAEALAIFSLVVGALFPLLHTGRVWRTAYWLFPYDFLRNIWPNVRTPLLWDVSAIVAYLSGTVLFVFVDLIPDLAVLRDRSQGWRRRVYGALALGFRGTTRQWRVQTAAGKLLSALVLAVFVAVNSTAAWNLSMALVPGWHSTALAPFFIAGALHSGVAAVVTTMVVLRRVLRLEQYITREHFDVVGRLQIAIALAYAFYFLMDFTFGLFAREPVEVAIRELRLLSAPTNVLLLVQVLATMVVPIPLWLFRRCRRSLATMFWLSLLVNVGMFLDRYLLVVTPLSLKQPFVFTWVATYVPRPLEYLLTAASAAFVVAGLLVFAKLLPIVPLWDVKEGQVVNRQLTVGRATVPAALRIESDD